MKKDGIAKLEEKKKHLLKWLNRYNKAHDVVPYVQRNLEPTEWEIEALSNQPDEAAEIPILGLSENINRDYNLILSNLPMMPEYEVFAVSNSTSVTTSGTSTVYGFVARVGDLDTPEAQSYSQFYLGKYHQLQKSQSRAKNVRALISKLRNTQTLERFNKAENSFSLFKVGTTPKTSSATEMRTLIDGVKGDLFDRACKWPKENMTWETMVERLVEGKIERQELTCQKGIHSSLVSRLSDVLKERESGSATNLENIWTQVLDYLFVLLSLINLEET